MDLLLQAKLAAPLIRDRLVGRSHLFRQLEDGLLQVDKLQRKLTLVSTPAGYGKTALVASWLQVAKLPFARLSLDKADNDLTHFLHYPITANDTQKLHASTINGAILRTLSYMLC